ncbi:uncharacterized protein K02A2.6-like [Sinocyclocheilus grahami]|uniref:uncharacterized protein K02A2.6-like n=1 Tax=Sinocyclocheilus grahami TaxID=75366 RepID=UPI0007AD0CF1|nr:PREDICTED: uncharacterized protein K02A2.6-like [Sinocyclocheilus grahami]
MEQLGVIEEVSEPTPWCAPMVPVAKKNGDIRICVDLKQLNEVVIREKYVLPTLDDVTSKLAGATVFSSLDAASGFWQIPLDDASKRLTTFITLFKRYCFRRLPFGITSTPEIFQKRMSELLRNVEGVCCYMDDILVYGRTREEHDHRLDEVLNTIHASGLKLKKEKCIFGQKELGFVGHRLSKEGIRPDPEKVRAIRDLSKPQNLTELKLMLGMINYLCRYLPHSTTVLQPLNELLRDDRVWRWYKSQEEAFTKVKEMLVAAPALPYYDVNKPTVVTADASSYGIGGALLQEHDGKMLPVAFCSHTLTAAEKRYAQIEKECLASVWTCEKLSQYLCSLESFKVLTDHKPLVPLINQKTLDEVPIRCQRLLIRMMRFNPVAVYTPGKSLLIVDTLSRHPLANSEQSDLEEEVEAYVAGVEEHLPASPQKLHQIADAMKADEELQSVLKNVQQGWPKHIKAVPVNLRAYFSQQGFLSESAGLLLHGSRIVIPIKMRDEVLARIHEGHQGLSKCRERACLSVWWPGISSDLKRNANQCQLCQNNKPTQCKEPLLVTKLPPGPWRHLGVDLCEAGSHQYLVVVDYYSRFIEIAHLVNMTSRRVIGKLKSMFARFGIPERLCSDNARQFTSVEFKTFTEQYGFVHVTSSPHFPQSNGEAERAVQTAKKILKQDDPFLALLAYRATPIAATGCSPSQLLMGRHLRTTVPVMASNLDPEWPDLKRVEVKDRKAKDSYRYFFNRRHGARSLLLLSPGDSVRLKLDGEKEWKTKGIGILLFNMNEIYPAAQQMLRKVTYLGFQVSNYLRRIKERLFLP